MGGWISFNRHIGRWSEMLDGSSMTWQDKNIGSKWDGQRMWSIVDIDL